MAKDKSLGVNPVHNFHKKAKQTSINKSRSEKNKLRDIKLQQKRPENLQKQLDELKNLQTAGRLNSHDRALLLSLEKDLARIRKLQADGHSMPHITSEKLQGRNTESRYGAKISKHPAQSLHYDSIGKNASCM